MSLIDAAVRLARDGRHHPLLHLLAAARGRPGPHRRRAEAPSRSLARVPIRAEELFGFKELVTPEGDLRSLPSHLAQLGGIDGFYAARLVKQD